MDELITALYVYGGNLDVERVNPLGASLIYDFSYYMNTNWMSQGLIDSINNWQKKIESYQDEYTEAYIEYKKSLNKMSRIEHLCTLENNFNNLELEELRPFIRYGEYHNKAFSFLNGMTEKDKSDISYFLYQQAKQHMQKLSGKIENQEVDCGDLEILKKLLNEATAKLKIRK